MRPICAPIGRRDLERPFGVKPDRTAVEGGPAGDRHLASLLHGRNTPGLWDTLE